MEPFQIRHLAELAELSLSDDDERRMADEIGRILAYVAELDAIDTSGVPATTQVTTTADAEAQASWRPDDLSPSLAHDDALREAPRKGHGGFLVPTFVTDSQPGAK